MIHLAARIVAKYKKKKLVDSENGGKTTVYMYSDKQIAHRNSEKAKRLEALSKKIGNLRAKVKKDLKSSDPETALTALVVSLMDHTAERIGNPTSAEENEHYGVTGWQKSHVSFGKGGHASIKYTGKSGVEQSKKVTDKAILTALKNAYEACEDDDGSLFEHPTGKVTAAKVNAYLKPFGISAKDIRGLHANVTMREQLKAVRAKGGKLPEDKKERAKKLKDEFKAALEATAEAVGHEASTLEKQYLTPGTADSYLKDGTVMAEMHKKASFDEITMRVAARYEQATWIRQANEHEEHSFVMFKPLALSKGMVDSLRGKLENIGVNFEHAPYAFRDTHPRFQPPCSLHHPQRKVHGVPVSEQPRIP